MKTDNEDFEQQLLSKLKGIKRISPNPDLLPQITQKIETHVARAIPNYYWTIAASVALLVVLNGVAIFYATNSENKASILNPMVNPVVTSFNIYGNE